MRFRCGFSDFKTKLDANALFVTFTHRTIRYDVNARVTSAAYYSQLSKHSHLQRVPCVDKTRTNMSRLVANTSHPVNNHYNSNPDTFWTNLVVPSLKKECNYTSTPLLGLHGRLKGEFHFFTFYYSSSLCPKVLEIASRLDSRVFSTNIFLNSHLLPAWGSHYTIKVCLFLFIFYT